MEFLERLNLFSQEKKGSQKIFFGYDFICSSDVHEAKGARLWRDHIDVEAERDRSTGEITVTGDFETLREELLKRHNETGYTEEPGILPGGVFVEEK